MLSIGRNRWAGKGGMKQGAVPSSKARLFFPISQEITLSPGKAGIQEEREGPASYSLTLNGEALCAHPHSFSQATGKGGHTWEGHKEDSLLCAIGSIWTSGLKPALTACSSSDYGFCFLQLPSFSLPLVPQLHNTPQSPGSELLSFASVACPDQH